MYKRLTIRERNIDILAGSVIDTELDSGSPDHGSDVVGELNSILGVPRDVLSVGVDRSGEGRSVVAAPSDKHESGLGDLSASLELVLLVAGSNLVLSIYDLDRGRGVGVLGVDELLRVVYVRGVDLDGVGGPVSSSWVDNRDSVAAVAVGVAVAISMAIAIGRSRVGSVRSSRDHLGTG